MLTSRAVHFTQDDSPTVREALSNYIASQRKHHRKISFREQLLRMLAEVGVVYHPKYLEQMRRECDPFGVEV